MIKIAEENPQCHFLIDEVHLDDNALNAISTDIIMRMSQIISDESYLWIACQGDKKPYEKDKNLAGITLFIMTKISSHHSN